MDTRERLREDIDRTTGDVVAKIRALEDRAMEIKEQVRESVTLRHQVEERPWTLFGIAMATGFVVGVAWSR